MAKFIYTGEEYLNADHIISICLILHDPVGNTVYQRLMLCIQFLHKHAIIFTSNRKNTLWREAQRRILQF